MNQPFNALEHQSAERPELVIDLHDGTNEQVSIIVVHHDRPELLNICVQSIYCMSNLSNYELIIVDNGSGPETQEYLDAIEQEGIKVVRNKDNRYWSAAANQGAKVADKNSKYLIFMHCDTVVLNQSWLDVMVNVSVGRAAGLVGCQLQSYYVAKQKINFIPEWCILVTRECWNDCGPWPEELPLIGNAFILTLRAQVRGYKPAAMNNALVHHYRAISYKPNEYERLSEQAMAIVPKLMQAAQS